MPPLRARGSHFGDYYSVPYRVPAVGQQVTPAKWLLSKSAKDEDFDLNRPRRQKSMSQSQKEALVAKKKKTLQLAHL